MFIFNIAIVDAIRSAYRDPFEAVFEKGVHRGCIQQLSISPTRSFFITVGEDKTCKFWEYGGEYRGLFSHFFHEMPLCLSTHPLSI